MAALFDTNIWIFLLFDQHPFHQPATDCLNTFSHRNSVLFNRETQKSFLRLVTTASITKGYGCDPLTNAQAWQCFHHFLQDDRISYAEEPPKLNQIWEFMSSSENASPKVWMDAYLAAFAKVSNLQFVTADAGFQQFPDLNLLLVR